MKPQKGKVIKQRALFLAVCLAFSFSASTSFAKDDEAALEKLGSFKRTDAAPMKRVAQDPKYAENLKKVLQQIKLPDGFKIELFAIVPDARGMAVSRNTATVWVGTLKSIVYSVNDRDMDGVADTVVKAFAGKVKHWITLNEIRCFTVLGYAKGGKKAPGRAEPGRTHTVIRMAPVCAFFYRLRPDWRLRRPVRPVLAVLAVLAVPARCGMGTPFLR